MAKNKKDTKKNPKEKERVVKGSNTFKEQGRPGERLIESFDKTERRQDTLKLQDYRDMLNDGQVFMLWNAITTIINAAGFKINEDEDYEGEEESPQKQFIETNLLSPVWKGGLSTSLEKTVRIMLRAFVEGFRVFEAVYRIGDDGFVYLDKLAPRAGKEAKDLKVLVNKVGEFIGFWQRIPFENKMIDVKVVNEGPLLKAIKSTYGEEFGSLYGRSGLKGAWYHYDKAHKLMYLFNIGSELGMIGYMHVESDLSDEQRDELLSLLAHPHLQNTVHTPKDSTLFNVLDVTDSGVMKETREMINVQYSLVAKSMLAQFSDLGSSMSSTGSRSLGESQTDFFKEGLQAMANILIEEPMNQLIAGLIKVNFGGDIYPTFKVNEIQDESAENIYAAFLEFVKKGEVPDSIKTNILVEASNEMGIEVNKEEVAEEIEEAKQQDVQNEKDMIEAKKSQPVVKQDKADLADVDEFVPMRPLFPDEQKVKLVAMKRKMTEGRVQAELTMRTLLEGQQEDIVDSYLAQLNGGKKKKLNLADTQDILYSEELEQMSIDMMEFGKTGAANELEAKIPVTTSKDRQNLLDGVGLIIADQETRLALRLQGVINNAKVSNLPEQDTEDLLNQEYEGFFDSVLSPTLSIVIPKAMNWGRRLAFRASKAIIWGYRYTATLDGVTPGIDSRTTDYCKELDGKILQDVDPDYYMLEPPNHFGCRSIYTPITHAEQKTWGFKADGKPDGVPVYSSVSTFKDLGLSEVEEEIRNVLGLNGETVKGD